MGRRCGGHHEVVEKYTISSDYVRKPSHLFKQSDFIGGAKLSRGWVLGDKTIHKVLIIKVSQWNGLVGPSDI